MVDRMSMVYTVPACMWHNDKSLVYSEYSKKGCATQII